MVAIKKLLHIEKQLPAFEKMLHHKNISEFFNFRVKRPPESHSVSTVYLYYQNLLMDAYMYIAKGGEATVVDVFVVKKPNPLVLSWYEKESSFGLGCLMNFHGSIH